MALSLGEESSTPVLRKEKKISLSIYICTDNSVHIFNYVSSGPPYTGLDKECRLFKNTILRLKILSEDKVSVLKKCFYWTNIQLNVIFLWQKIILVQLIWDSFNVTR